MIELMISHEKNFKYTVISYQGVHNKGEILEDLIEIPSEILSKLNNRVIYVILDY